jgi:hypothetical protein
MVDPEMTARDWEIDFIADAASRYLERLEASRAG